MSKAFTRESDDAPEPPSRPRPPAVPPGAKNYVTAEGARRLQAELDRLIHSERPKLAAASLEKNALKSLDEQILHLQESLAMAVVVAPPPPPWQQVRFGATVGVRNRQGEVTRHRLVGVDETEVDRGWISWRSPIARALLNARLGQRVPFTFPSGDDELEIISIEYE